VSVRELKVEGVSAYYAGLFDKEVVGDAVFKEELFAGPFVDACCTRASTAELGGVIETFAAI